LELPVEAPQPLIAVGPHLKNTFTLAHGRRAFVSQHIGDLDNLETAEHWQATLQAYRRLFRVVPEIAVRDLHPDYLSTRLAEELGLERIMAVQHHHAHIAAVLAEHGRAGPAIGVAFDGTGYGDDGHTWGAEIVVADLAGYRRAGHLQYAPMPGGDVAARQPWRSARGYLSLEPGAAAAFARAFDGMTSDTLVTIDRQIAGQLNAPLASSMGRLFDAAAAILGVRRVSAYEGQAAMELEALAGTRHAAALPFPVSRHDEGWVLDPVPLLAALGKRARAGHNVAELAAAFHESIAAGTAELVRRVADAEGLRTAALGGGVFQNARLLRSLEARLTAMHIEVLVPRHLSPNDGAVSYGQAAVAAARLRQEQGG
jgi:hydrogenase maturation protein HypF